MNRPRATTSGWRIASAGPRVLASLLALLAGLGAAPPEIIRVRAPADRLGDVFPKGTELKVLPPDEFDSLVDRAGKNAAQSEAAVAARIVRARHRARWGGGMLRGSTSLTLQGSSSALQMIPLTPWTPAIRDNPRVGSVLGLSASGQAGLWIRSADSVVDFEWELVARPESRGRGFTLGLPGEASSTLVLELPKGWTPSGPGGIRVGPLPSESDPGISRWEFAGTGGTIDLRFHDPNDPETVEPGGRLWIGGETRIDLRGPNARGSGIGNWTTEWTVESDRLSPGRFSMRLDPGLELISVNGPDIDQFQTRPAASGTGLEVVFAHGVKTSTKIRFFGQVNAPLEGPWKVPTIKPDDAIWTGGTTTILFDDTRVVTDCRELGGRRVASPGGNVQGRDAIFSFDMSRPTSVAVLTLRAPSPDSTCLVLGQLHVGHASPSLDCRLKWTTRTGIPPQLEFVLPPSWIPDRVQILGLDDALAWHSASLPDGARRITVLVPTTLAARREMTLILGASSTFAGGRGKIELPRIRPLNTRVVDECWVARVDSSLRLEPTAARGIAWIDPFQTRAFDRRTGFPDLSSNEARRIALAWRWLEGNATLTAAIGSVDAGSSASIRTHARLASDGKSLILDGTIAFKSSDRVDALPLWLPPTGSRLSDWRFELIEGEDSGRKPLEHIPLDRARQAELGFPEDGICWSIALPAGARNAATVAFRGKMEWTGRGKVPLPSLPKSQVPRSLISVEIPRDYLATVSTERLRDLNAAATETPLRVPEAERRGPREANPSETPIVSTYSYSDPTAKLELITEKMGPTSLGPIVRQATLTTTLDAGGQFLNRLRLQVQPEGKESIEFEMPEDATLARILVEGKPVESTRQANRYTLPIPPASASASSVAVTIESITAGDRLGASALLRPSSPKVEATCLSFTWEILRPPGWELADSAEGRVEVPRVRWPFASLGLGRWRWWDRAPRDASPSAETYLWLEEKLQPPPVEDLTLAECFSRWDSGKVPLIVDRLAISSLGLGPRSMLRNRPVEAGASNTIAKTLGEMGITLVALDRALIVTTPASSAADTLTDSQRVAAVDRAIAWGSDLTDRYQSVTRWRGEMSPRGTSESAPRPALKVPPGWALSRITSAGWPDDSFAVRMVNRPDEVGRALWTAILLTALFLAWGVAGLRHEATAITAILAVCSFSLILDPGPAEPFLAGGFLASIIATIVRGLRGLARGGEPPSPAQPRVSSLVKQASYTTASAISLAVSVPLLAAEGRVDGGDSSKPIVAVLPYEGEFDLNRAADRVILRLEDYRRLLRLAEGPPPRGVESIRATSIVHRVERVSRQEAVVETDYAIRQERPEAANFEVVVSGTHRISATLDGVEAPVLIRPNGGRASIMLAGEGTHRLTLRRSVTLLREQDVSRLLLGIDRFPGAMVEVSPTPQLSPLDRVASHGSTALDAGRKVSGLLGPVDQLDVTWKESRLAAASRSTPTVEGLLLWDVESAGDRLRARYTYHGVQRLSTLRFKVEPDLIPRSIQCPGFVDIRQEQGVQEATWVVHVDPPLPNHSTIGLEFWRPLSNGAAAGVPDSKRQAASASNRHVLPRIEPIDIERLTGAIGVRRPGNWTGRLAPLAGVEPITDETFVKLWGDLPPEPLTLSGITRFVRPTPIELRTGPAHERIRVRPSADVRISGGRIDVDFDSEFTDSLGVFQQAELQLPKDFRISRVEAGGLTDWSVGPDQRLRLRFDRPDLPRRKLGISGWIPVDVQPLASGSRKLRSPTPWIRWLDVDVDPGMITLTMASKPTIEGGAGIKRVTEEQSPATSAESVHRSTYRIDDASTPGDIVWEQVPPRLTVSIESQLVVHRGWADWTAVLRYDAIGGSLDTLNFNLPTEWAAEAQILLPGNPAQVTKISRDVTSYTINPERPIWGSQRVIIRGEKPLPPQGDLRFPELTPLGRGVTDTYLNLVNGTGEPYRVVSASSLQEVGDSGRFHGGGFDRSFTDPNSAATYHVKDAWSLLLKFAGNPASASPNQEATSRVNSADLRITELPGRKILGEATYEIGGGAGWFLPVELPSGCEMVFAVADQIPVNPFRTAEGRWMVPLERNQTRRVRILWSGPRGHSTATGELLTLPAAGSEPASTIVRANLVQLPTPDTESAMNRLQAITPDRLMLMRAAAISKQIRDGLGSFDRTSFRARENLASSLIGHELALRESSRSATRQPGSPERASAPSRVSQNIAAADTERNALSEALRVAGLADVEQIARSYLGTISTNVSRPVFDPLESNRLPRIRDAGTPTFHYGTNHGVGSGDREDFSIKLSSGGTRVRPATLLQAGVLLVPLLISIGLTILPVVNRRAWPGLLGPATMLGWVGLAGGAMPLVVVVLGSCLVGVLRRGLGLANA